jgi:hypothetical protein
VVEATHSDRAETLNNTDEAKHYRESNTFSGTGGLCEAIRLRELRSAVSDGGDCLSWSARRTVKVATAVRGSDQKV